MKVLGVMIGREDMVLDFVEKNIFTGLDIAKRTLLHPLMPTQIVYHLTRLCLLPRFNYTARTTPPALTTAVAQRFDAYITSLFCEKNNINQEQLAPGTNALYWLQQPIRSGGLGLRPSSRVLHSAFLASSLQAASVLKYSREEINAKASTHLQRMFHSYQQLLSSLPNLPSFHALFNEQPVKLQYKWVSSIESALPIPHASEKTDARHTSVTNKHARRWLTTLPTQSEFILSNNHFTSAIRHYLLLPPTPFSFQCACSKLVFNDPLHFHVCQVLRKSITTIRHDHVASAFSRLLETNFFNVYVEPRLDSEDGGKERPDVHVAGLSVNMFVEFSLLHPLCETYLKHKDPIRTREQSKINKYKVDVERAGGTIGAVVFDAFGRLGKEGELVIKTLAKNVDNPSDFLHSMYTTLSFAVQRGNGKMLDRACLYCRLPNR
jgi:hypothetical protein